MARGFFLVTMSFVNNGIDLFLGKSRITPQLAIGFEFIVSRGVELNPVRAVVNLLAHGLARRPGAVHSLIIPGQAHLRRTEHSLTSGDQTHGRDLHTRTLEKAAVDSFLDVHIRVPAPVAHQIAQGRESRPQVLLRVRKRKERPVFARVVYWAGERGASGLDVVQPKSENVSVSVD